MIEWRSASEWAEFGLPGLPTTKRGVTKTADREGWQRRERAGNGGGFEYHYSNLPETARAAYLLRNAPRPKRAEPQAARDQDAAWATYERLTFRHREEAERRLNVLLDVEGLITAGIGKLKAIETVASEAGTDPATIRRWFGLVKGVERRNWLPALAPRYVGSTENRVECDPRAWDWYLAHYLTRRQPTHAEAYRRLEEVAAAEGWTIPSARTLIRRVESEVDRFTIVLKREGVEAVAKLTPRPTRDATVFAAGEVVNGDGLKFDRLWVRFPDGEIINTATAWVYQDVRTRKVLAWRLGKTENTDIFRLATYDLTEVCAPQIVYVDNTRVAANKQMTAGASGRYRFKDKDHDGLGILPALGITVEFTNPDTVTGTPGSKPIERAFGIGGIHDKVATHPSFVDRGYSKATAIDAEELREVLAQEIDRHNAQKARRTEACRGVLSFDDAWEEATRSIVFRTFSESQRRMLLMVREPVRIDETGALAIKAGRSAYNKNRYWSEASARMAGKRVIAHFDPDNLHAGVHAYSLSGDYLFEATHMPTVAFNDTTVGRELARFRKQRMKAIKKAAEAEVRMSELEHAQFYANATRRTPPDDPAPARSDRKVVAAHFARTPDPRRDALRTGTDDAPAVVAFGSQSLPEEDTDQFAENFARNVRALHEKFRKEQL